MWPCHFINIVRFESTIAGQFFGHAHDDRFRLLIDFETSPIPRPYWYRLLSNILILYSVIV